MDYTKTWLHQGNFQGFKERFKPTPQTKRAKLIIFFSVFFIFLVGCQGPQVINYREPETVSYELTGEITNEKEADNALGVIEENLNAVSEGNLECYLETIVSDGVEETEEELQETFTNLDLEITILSAEVIDQEEDKMLIQIYQQTIAKNMPNEKEGYRDHVAEANYTMVKEANEWKIQETAMTNTQFIEYPEQGPEN